MMDESQSRDDWKYPLISRFKNWLIGFGAAVLVIIFILYGVYLYTQKTNDVITKPAIPVIANPVKLEPVKRIALAKPSVKVHDIPETMIRKKPKPVEPETQFDRDLANFESKL